MMRHTTLLLLLCSTCYAADDNKASQPVVEWERVIGKAFSSTNRIVIRDPETVAGVVLAGPEVPTQVARPRESLAVGVPQDNQQGDRREQATQQVELSRHSPVDFGSHRIQSVSVAR